MSPLMLTNTLHSDQRIVQDVDKACVVFSEIIAKILISPFTAGYYLYKCAEK